MNLYSKLELDFVLSAEEQSRLNLRRRIALVRHVYHNIPFYHKKYLEAGVDIDSLKTDEDFARLPLLTKDEVRNSFHEMISKHDSLDCLLFGATGGSTGEPVRFYFDPGICMSMLGWPAASCLGINPCDSVGVVGRGVPSSLKQNLHDLLFFPQKNVYLDAATTIDSKAMKRFAEGLIRSKAKYIRGYVGGIVQFAEYCRQHNLSFPSLRMIWTSSAPLPEFQRKILQDTFKCPAYTQYGCCEMPWLGMECVKQCGLHTFPTIRHVEITDDDGKPMPPETIGKVVITDLLDFRFPLIRYVNGDRSAFLSKKCDCGNHAPLLDYIQGRVTDCLTLSDGSFLFGDFLTTVFDQRPNAVKAFQFHQLRDGTIRFSIVKNNQYSNASKEIEEVISGFRQLIAGRNTIDINFCESISSDRGKTRFVIKDK